MENETLEMEPPITDAGDPAIACQHVIDEVVFTPRRDRCEHGVYIAKGDSSALYCTGCNPGFARIIKNPARVMDVVAPEKVVDVGEYLNAPVWERLEFAAQMESMQ